MATPEHIHVPQVSLASFVWCLSSAYNERHASTPVLGARGRPSNFFATLPSLRELPVALEISDLTSAIHHPHISCLL